MNFIDVNGPVCSTGKNGLGQIGPKSAKILLRVTRCPVSVKGFKQDRWA